uniref:Uncharacterized protein n=2 Tax=Clytia hemisphaerica TaxID=252671 RepID=A0A7M5U5J6_9CNID
GFFGFEAMTVRDLQDAICGHCGIAGKVYFGDGNEKNCCSIKDDMLKLNVQELYATILVGISACHQFVKSPGHTGGFYHIVCPHGITVASKFMILTESVRDPADLYKFKVPTCDVCL